MVQIDKLIQISKEINMLSETAQLCFIKERTTDSNCELILPLVGEFSAGKTTLINALTDSKQLETATKPTTATIYEIHFGADSNYAEIYDVEGNKTQVDNISELKNEGLGDSLVVNVFDRSTLVPSNIVLVDTPGLSSPDPRHKQTLIEFLPKADGILLVVDVNQQITRSLTDFVKTMELAKKPVFLVITKSDTKADSELTSVKEYIAKNCNLPLSQVACVSASNGNIEELSQLLQSIQQEKGKILAQVNEQRIKDIVNLMLQHINEMLSVSSSDKELEESIRKKEQELKKINRNIDALLSSTQLDIEDEERCITRKFEDIVFERMDTIVASKSDNYDAEAINAINSLASIYLNDFKNRVHQIIYKKASNNTDTEKGINLQSLHSIDLSGLSVGNLSYGLDLNSIGHEYDGMIATGVKVAAAAAAVAAVVATAGAAGAAGAGAAGTTGAAGAIGAGGTSATAVGVGTMVEAADIVTDVGSIISNQKHISRVERAMVYAGEASKRLEDINNLNSNIGQQMGQRKGMVEGLVGFVTDKTWGKPQRRRAIRMYIDGTLMPQFKLAMNENSQQVVNSVSETLHAEAEVTINEKKTSLEQLRKQLTVQVEEFKKRLELLRDYKKELLTM